jgi:hypothetical protein
VTALYYHSFYNIGVRPTVEDLWVGETVTLIDSDNTDRTLTYPKSFTRQLQAELLGDDLRSPEKITQQADPCTIPFANCTFPTDPQEIKNWRVAVDGAFKVPTLRNVGLTPPYMHNGGFSNLHQVVEFYNRGGNKRSQECVAADGTVTPANTTQSPDREPDPNGVRLKECDNFDADIKVLGLTPQEESDLVAFLLSLTDNRVACQAGIFDHPSLPLPNGHPDDGQPATIGEPIMPDIVVTLPATGVGGLPAEGKPCLSNSGDLFGPTQQAFRQITR